MSACACACARQAPSAKIPFHAQATSHSCRRSRSWPPHTLTLTTKTATTRRMARRDLRACMHPPSTSPRLQLRCRSCFSFRHGFRIVTQIPCFCQSQSFRECWAPHAPDFALHAANALAILVAAESPSLSPVTRRADLLVMLSIGSRRFRRLQRHQARESLVQNSLPGEKVLVTATDGFAFGQSMLLGSTARCLTHSTGV
ncbi:hypothetical protein IE81DRAFT_150880 [Ceraceosorus guamensis]|uniref:Uncharacterized protein n=1 Tax=Ceraceosorus guamensis TaxID=1522189 RepID=A0A316VX21_9BASI|nr:hypothetical protein IE81DRAFT_150880 [Ceraceosorus guamensis]PWN42002.1 hypothetical protein IE81DRAFT_150880 [Ceraceosorus guamensis]